MGKKAKPKAKATRRRAADLSAKRDPKGGIIAVLIGLKKPQTPKPSEP